jgi:tetratricopeptide (TPR) repeat protein
VTISTLAVQSAGAAALPAAQPAPVPWASRRHLVETLMAAKQYPQAKALLQEWFEQQPQDSEIQHQLGRVCVETGETQSAIRHFEQAIALDPNDADSQYWIGGIQQKLGYIDAAKAAYTEAARIRPQIRHRPVKTPPDFRVLVLYAPFSGNTPIEYLFRDATYDIDTLAFFGPREPDIASLGDFDVVLNLMSDADQDEAMLPAALSLAEKLGKPVVNNPGKIQRTTRDAVADLLRDIAACQIPRILRLDAGTEVSAAALATLLPFAFPVLARPAGTHGGGDFEKLESIEDLAGFLAQRPGADHYVTEYVDYASGDGHFRKYRFIFVGEQILPYHLAIGNGWKVHHLSTDMAHQPWMQQEEAVFLADPTSVFDATHFQALRAIRERIGLDYFGIDCGLDSDGNLLVFEVNASMLVHDDIQDFPYKDPFVRAIKAAFGAMLQSRASRCG